MKEPTPPAFILGNTPYVAVDTVSKKAFALIKDNNNNFMNALGVKDGDELLEMNGTPIDASSPMNVLIAGYGLEEAEAMVMKVKRKGEIIELKGKVKLNYVDGTGYKFTDQGKALMKNAWLKN